MHKTPVNSDVNYQAHCGSLEFFLPSGISSSFLFDVVPLISLASKFLWTFIIALSTIIIIVTAICLFFMHLQNPSTAKRKTTLPHTNITTENGGLKDYLSFWDGNLLGAILASGRVTFFIGWLLFGIFPQWPKNDLHNEGK